MQHLLRLAGFLLLALILSGCSKEVTLPPLAEDAVILAFGDSLTYGTGTTEEHSYPAVLQQLSGRVVINAGIPGELSSEGLRRLPQTLANTHPNLLILCLGGNDMLHRKSASEVEDNLEKMVAISRSHGVPVLLLGVPQLSLLGLKSAELYHVLAERLSLPLEGEIIPALLSNKALKSDHIHPNTAGYRLMAEAIYQKLQRSGAL